MPGGNILRSFYAFEPGPQVREFAALAGRLGSKLTGIKLECKPLVPHVALGYVEPGADQSRLREALRLADDGRTVPLHVSRLVLVRTIPNPEHRSATDVVRTQPNRPIARYNAVQLFSFTGTSRRAEQSGDVRT